MDHPFRVVSLCTGAGGLDRGVHLAEPTARTILYVEHEATAILQLVARMEDGWLDPAPLWTDLKSADLRGFRGVVDCVVGGIPCQPHSYAGKRLGAEDERDLWPDAARLVAECEPEWCFFENVPGVLPYVFHRWMPELQAMGYMVEVALIEAAEVGAPHKRERLFLMAHRSGSGLRETVGDLQAGEPDAIGGGNVAHRAGFERRQAGEQLAGQLAVASRSQQLAHRADARHTAAGEHGSGSPLPSARPEQRSGGMANAERARREKAGRGRQEHARAQPQPRGSGVADTSSGQLPVTGRETEGRAGAGSASAVLAYSERERGRGGNSGRADANDALAPSAILPEFPPGPNDFTAWERILRERPDLAPATKPEIRGVVDGLGDRLDESDLPRTARLRLTGNGVVPLQAAWAWRVLRARFE